MGHNDWYENGRRCINMERSSVIYALQSLYGQTTWERTEDEKKNNNNMLYSGPHAACTFEALQQHEHGVTLPRFKSAEGLNWHTASSPRPSYQKKERKMQAQDRRALTNPFHLKINLAPHVENYRSIFYHHSVQYSTTFLLGVGVGVQ